MHHAFKLGEAEHNLELSRALIGYRLHLADGTGPVNLHLEDDGSAVLTVNGHSEKVLVAMRGDDVFIHLGGVAYQLCYEHPLQRLATMCDRRCRAAWWLCMPSLARAWRAAKPCW